ncbi:MAG: hypothetical protein ACK50Q_08500 [Labrys sp. (in: a-proteobacteria)]
MDQAKWAYDRYKGIERDTSDELKKERAAELAESSLADYNYAKDRYKNALLDKNEAESKLKELDQEVGGGPDGGPSGVLDEGPAAFSGREMSDKKSLGERVEHAINVASIATSIAAGTFGQPTTLAESAADAYSMREAAVRESVVSSSNKGSGDKDR